MSDAGSRLLFKFRSGTHGLNEELGRHRGREEKVYRTLCGAECECSACVVRGVGKSPEVVQSTNAADHIPHVWLCGTRTLHAL